MTNIDLVGIAEMDHGGCRRRYVSQTHISPIERTRLRERGVNLA